MRTLLLCLLLLLLPVTVFGQTPKLAKAAPRTTATTDIFGKAVQPVRTDDRVATVLLFIVRDCPISNAYAPEINRIIGDYKPKGVAFYVVYVDPDLTLTDLQKHYREFGYRCPALDDRAHRLVKQWKAHRTPEAVVIDRTGKAIYQGRIDDLYIDFGKARHQAQQRDLRYTLSAITRNEPVTPTTTPVIGCPIPDAS